MASSHRMRRRLGHKPKTEKQRHRVVNWRQYNRALVRRGSLTLWIDAEVRTSWLAASARTQGRPFVYSDSAILCALSVRHLFRLSLRMTQGFLHSALPDLPIPDYTTLCRRARSLSVPLAVRSHGHAHLVFDSTGLKVFGEGEWKVRQYGWCRRRTWHKVHLALDQDTQEIRAVSCTDNATADVEEFPLLLGEVAAEAASMTGDGGYDARAVYELLHALHIPFVIPPSPTATAKYSSLSTDPSGRRRRFVQRIHDVGRTQWKQESGYHRRSIVETTMNRWKRIFGDRVKSRTLDRENTDVHIQARILNIFTALGMPQSIRMA